MIPVHSDLLNTQTRQLLPLKKESVASTAATDPQPISLAFDRQIFVFTDARCLSPSPPPPLPDPTLSASPGFYGCMSTGHPPRAPSLSPTVHMLGLFLQVHLHAAGLTPVTGLECHAPVV